MKSLTNKSSNIAVKDKNSEVNLNKANESLVSESKSLIVDKP